MAVKSRDAWLRRTGAGYLLVDADGLEQDFILADTEAEVRRYCVEHGWRVVEVIAFDDALGQLAQHGLERAANADPESE